MSIDLLLDSSSVPPNHQPRRDQSRLALVDTGPSVSGCWLSATPLRDSMSQPEKKQRKTDNSKGHCVKGLCYLCRVKPILVGFVHGGLAV